MKPFFDWMISWRVFWGKCWNVRETRLAVKATYDKRTSIYPYYSNLKANIISKYLGRSIGTSTFRYKAWNSDITCKKRTRLFCKSEGCFYQTFAAKVNYYTTNKLHENYPTSDRHPILLARTFLAPPQTFFLRLH